MTDNDCICDDDLTQPDPNCPMWNREERLRRTMAAAWDDGMAAFSQGLGSDANPYRKPEDHR